jgi:hypothetical protein
MGNCETILTQFCTKMCQALEKTQLLGMILSIETGLRISQFEIMEKMYRKRVIKTIHETSSQYLTEDW